MHNLTLYPPNTGYDYKVKAHYSVVDKNLVAQFEVEFSNDLITSDAFKKDTLENWGLWDFDVVELFLSRSDGSLPYLEIQTSALGQLFALVVTTPRSEFTYPQNLDVKVENSVAKNIWKAKISVPVDQIPGNLNTISGNLHACLGSKENRYYFGYKTSDRIDFHRPDHFIKMGEIS